MESLAPAKAEGTELRPKHILFGWENSQKSVLSTNPDLHGENNGIPLDCDLSHSGRYITFTGLKEIPYTRSEGTHFPDCPSKAVFVLDLQTSGVRQVVPFGHLCESPVFSGDDKHIAFYRAPLDIYSVPGNGDSNDAFGHRLCVVPVEGGEVQVLSPPSNTIFVSLGSFSPPCWSPDGKKILFVAQYNDPSLVLPPIDMARPDPAVMAQRRRMLPPGVYMVDLSTKKMERLTPAEWGKGAMCPSWAPDGKRFVCTLHDELTIVASETKTLTYLGQKATGWCVWAPRGNFIVFSQPPQPAQVGDTLSVISADGTHYVVVRSQLHGLLRLFWSD
jgi:hypothetical protein